MATEASEVAGVFLLCIPQPGTCVPCSVFMSCMTCEVVRVVLGGPALKRIHVLLRPPPAPRRAQFCDCGVPVVWCPGGSRWCPNLLPPASHHRISAGVLQRLLRACRSAVSLPARIRDKISPQSHTVRHCAHAHREANLEFLVSACLLRWLPEPTPSTVTLVCSRLRWCFEELPLFAALAEARLLAQAWPTSKRMQEFARPCF